MTRLYTFILILFFTTPLFSQKIMEKQLDIPQVERITINADGIYNIKVTAAKTTALTLRTHVTGEYAENVVLDIKSKGTSLTIKPGLTPFFNKNNDKLAAHKVMAIDLEVIVPQNLNVSVSSNLASLQCFGNFKYLQAYLDQGTCTISNFKGDGMIHTKPGDVTVKASPDVGVKARSKTGLISKKPYLEQYYTLEIKTVSGAITILETN